MLCYKITAGGDLNRIAGVHTQCPSIIN